MIEVIESNFRIVAEVAALAIEGVAILIIIVGALEAATVFLRHLFFDRTSRLNRRDIWLHFAGWIVLSLEFTLGADVIRTAIAPSWDDIGKLAAIAAIRTALNYFLAHDIVEAMELSTEKADQKR